MMKKITKVLAIGGIVTAGIAATVKVAKASAADAEKKKREIADIIILGHTGSGTNPHFEECHRCTCHGVPVPDAKASEKEKKEKELRCFSKGKIPPERKIIEANTAAMDSLDPDDRAFMKSLIDFLRETELVDELDESVTTASLIGYMKENGIFDKIHHICKKKNLACNDIEDIIHAVFKAGKFSKHMDAEQKLSVILDDISEDYFDSDLDEFDESDYE